MMSNEAMKDGTSFESPQWSSSSEADHSKIETEEQLFDLAKEIANRMHESRIKGFFDLGSCLLAFYPSQYGDETIQRLSEKIGFSTDNIYKARQFAENFSTEQVQELLSGKFTISWHTIRKNLSVKSVDFMLLYRDSVTLKEFNQKIEEYKQPKNLLEKGESNENCSSPTNFQGSVNQNSGTDTGGQMDHAPDADDHTDKDVDTDIGKDKDSATDERTDQNPDDVGNDKAPENSALNNDGENNDVSSDKKTFIDGLKLVENGNQSKTNGDQTDQNLETDSGENQDVSEKGGGGNAPKTSEKKDEDSEDLAKKVKEYEAQIKSLQDEIKTLKKVKADLEQKVIQLELENDMLKGQLDDLEKYSDEEKCDALTELDY